MSALADLYTIPEEYLDFRDTIRQIAQERIAPRAAEIDEKAEYPRDLRALLAEQDILGLPFETDYGGTGTGTLMLNMAVEEIAKACASTALILMIQELGTLPIRLFGTDEQKQRFLPRCATGEWSPAFALSEPDAGSDPGGMRTRAVRDGDEWVIDGTKNWITNLGKYSAMAKLFCSDVAMGVTVEAIQVLGGYGYVKEYPVERMLRDAKITQIYEGTNEIQRLVVARTLR